MIQPDDPRLTAFVLGELSDAEKQEIQAAIDESLALKKAVDDIRSMTGLLMNEFRAGATEGLLDEQKESIQAAVSTPIEKAATPGSQGNFLLKHWAWLAVAACAVALAIPMLQNGMSGGADQTAMKGPDVKDENSPKVESMIDKRSAEVQSAWQTQYESQTGMKWEEGDAKPDFDELIELITTTVDPDGVEAKDGGVTQFESDLSIIVSNTQEVTDDSVTSLGDDGPNTSPGAHPFSDSTIVPSELRQRGIDDAFEGQVVELNEGLDPLENLDAPARRLDLYSGSLPASESRVLMDTPRIIIQEEEEERVPGNVGSDYMEGRELLTTAAEQEPEVPIVTMMSPDGVLETYTFEGRRLPEGIRELSLAEQGREIQEEVLRTRLSTLREESTVRRGGVALNSLALDSEDVVDEAKLKDESDSVAARPESGEITDRIVADLRKKRPAIQPADAKKPASPKPKSWKRVKAIPNTSRLMIGDHEELDMNGMQVRVQVDGFRARVLVDCFYYNDRDRQLEGKFKLRLPDDASLYYFAFGQSAFDLTQDGELTRDEFIDPATTTRFVSLKPRNIKRVRGDVWRNVKESRMVPREKAAYAYSQTVRRRVDPALVEWSGAGVFNASVFPLMPKKLHRIVIGYDVDLQRTDDGLTYDLDLPTSIKQCKVDIDVREIDGTKIALNTKFEFSETRGDGVRRFRIDEPRGEEGEPIRLTIEGGHDTALVSRDEKAGNFFAMRTMLDLPADDSDGSEQALFFVDTSLSSRPDKFNVWLTLLEATLTNNRDSLKKFAVVFFDVESRFWRAEYVANTEENVESLLSDCQDIVLEGATDLYSAVRLVKDAAWTVEGDSPDVFLLSDGAVNWGEANLRLIERELGNCDVGSVFAYQSGMTGTSIASLRFLASETGGAVFSVASEAEVAKASTAHRARPWRLNAIELEGARDVLTAGRVQWVYPGQPLTVVGRLQDGADMADLNFVLSRGSETKTIAARPAELIESNLASRVYGHVAVGQLESLDEAELDVTTAYARHFRITGGTCSLLMLESEADYQRFNIKPEEDEFVVKTTDASELIAKTLEERAEELGDPKAQLMVWVSRLESMPGMNFKLPTALRLALDRIDVEAINDSLASSEADDSEPLGIPSSYVEQLSAQRLNYDAVMAESQRRGGSSSARAVKVLSSLIEQNPGDLVLARDVAFSSMEMNRPGQAYHLLRRVAKARPYDPSIYTALGQCLTQMDKADMAIVFYEIAIGGTFQNRAADYRKIAGTEYAFLLRQIASGQRESKIKSYAEARLETISDKCKIEENADLLVTMMWNTDQSDVDLHVVEPSGEECFYSHPKTRAGGHITRDITDGYGPEMYAINKAPAGNYNIAVKYFNTNRNRAGMRSKVYLTIYRDFGSGAESVTRQVVNITKPGQKERVETVRLK